LEPLISIRKKVRRYNALTQAGIADLTNVPVTEMSYGKQRQLEIAISLVTSPELLLLDEPAAGLSPSERSIVADVISNLPQSLTMILIEHDMDLALGLVDHVTCLYEGKLLVEAPPSEIRTNSLVQEVYLGKPHHA
jgi:branched-chain amino acid transport system ATP-binding protein